MNPELPKSIRSALAQKGSLTTHPSADVLTAFAERTLTAGENERVADHLAGCSECRQVLFLASDADEQPTAHTHGVAQIDLRPRPRWMPKIAWLASGVAGIVIVGGILVQQHLDHERWNQKVAQVRQVAPQQAPIAPSPRTSYELAVPPETEKPAPTAHAAPPAGKVSRQGSDMATIKPPRPNTSEFPPVASIPHPKPADQAPGGVVGGSSSSLSLAVPIQNSFAESPEGTPGQSFASAQMRGAPLGLMRRAAPTGTWRVSPEGHLEHLSQTGWTTALADQSVTFRVVAAAPNGVWAGGSQGELFHSEDGGANWNEIALPIPPDGKSDPIVSIHFADLQQGIALTESGTRYTTSDSGKNWQRE